MVVQEVEEGGPLPRADAPALVVRHHRRGETLGSQVLQFDYRPSPALFAWALFAALLVCALAAWTAARTATRTPPAESLRA